MSTTMSTQDLQWLLLRKSNSFLVKQRGLPRVFSKEPGNIGALHSYKFSGLINDKAVGVSPAPSGKGVVVTTKKGKAASNAVAGTRNSWTVSKGGPRHAAAAVAKIVAQQNYRADLLKPSVARASAIFRSQRPGGRKAPRARKVRGTKKPVATVEA